jgi:hypothetical protein
MTAYRKADTDWLAALPLGISVHWTAQTAPRAGKALPFAAAVAQFRLDAFLDAVARSGAGYVIFTATHALHMLPCPHPLVDGILPGRTAERDLLGELARGLAAIGRKLIVYYNHSCNHGDDPPWEQAVGYHAATKDRLAENICTIVQWLGETYGDLIAGWWFDSAWSLDPRGPYNGVTTDLQDFQFPWERLTVAAKAGHPDRLVTYNPGIGQSYLYTKHQDYAAGELSDLQNPPTARFLPNGLQWHGWICLDDSRWFYKDNRMPPESPRFKDEELWAFLRACRQHQAAMTFNVITFQDGTMANDSLEQLSRITHQPRSD